MARNHDGEPARDASSAERVLLFRLEGKLHGIRVSEIGGVVYSETQRPLPGAPAGVLGLGEWRGSVLTVLDLPHFLGCPPQDEPACLVRLAPPMDQTALYLPATVLLTDNPLEKPAAEPGGEAKADWTCGGESVLLVDPLEVVRRLETELSESG